MKRVAPGILLAGLLLPAPPAAAVEILATDTGRSTVTWVEVPPVTYHYQVQVVEPVQVVAYEVEPIEDDEELGLVEIGAGYGGFYMPSLRESLLQAPRAHLALVIDQVSVEFNLGVATGIEWGDTGLDGACASALGCGTGELVQSSLGFAWRWNPEGVLHPTAGASLELASLDPDQGDSSFAFTGAGMVGLIFEYPLPYGWIEVGVDATGHVKLVSQDAYPLEDVVYLTFGGYLGYRF